jgi:hypothetical protein
MLQLALDVAAADPPGRRPQADLAGADVAGSVPFTEGVEVGVDQPVPVPTRDRRQRLFHPRRYAIVAQFAVRPLDPTGGHDAVGAEDGIQAVVPRHQVLAGADAELAQARLLEGLGGGRPLLDRLRLFEAQLFEPVMARVAQVVDVVGRPPGEGDAVQFVAAQHLLPPLVVGVALLLDGQRRGGGFPDALDVGDGIGLDQLLEEEAAGVEHIRQRAGGQVGGQLLVAHNARPLFPVADELDAGVLEHDLIGRVVAPSHPRRVIFRSRVGDHAHLYRRVILLGRRREGGVPVHLALAGSGRRGRLRGSGRGFRRRRGRLAGGAGGERGCSHGDAGQLQKLATAQDRLHRFLLFRFELLAISSGSPTATCRPENASRF